MAGTLNVVTMDELYPERSRRLALSGVEGVNFCSLSGAEGRKNLAYCTRKSGASAPLSDRIFPALSGAEGVPCSKSKA
jgi:hypothetical protein